MPELPKHVDKICFHCRHYKIEIPGGAYCLHFKQYFPNKGLWARQDAQFEPGASGKKPGERDCKHWESK